MPRLTPRLGCLVLFLGLLGVITALALSPKPLPAASLGWDKLNHLAAFAALALSGRGAWPTGRWWRLWCGLLAYGLGLEWAQGLTPHRQAEAADVIADLMGVGLGQLGLWAWSTWQGRKHTA